MNISLTKKQEEYIAEQVQSGDYQNAAEVVRESLRLHELYRTRTLEELRAAVDKGWEGPASSRSVKDIITAKKQQPLTGE